MTTLELLEASFPLTAFFENLSIFQGFLLFLAIPTISGLFFVLLKFRSPLGIKIEYFTLTFCIGTIVSLLCTALPAFISPLYGTYTLTQAAAVLDTNFTVTLQDYHPSAQFRSAKISAPAVTETVMVLNKPVSASVPPPSFTISANALKKLEETAKEQNVTTFLSKL